MPKTMSFVVGIPHTLLKERDLLLSPTAADSNFTELGPEETKVVKKAASTTRKKAISSKTQRDAQTFLIPNTGS